MLTLTATRETASTILANRATIRSLTDANSALSDTLRPALVRWGAVVTDSGRTVYVTEASERVTPDADALATLARAYGAPESAIAECVKRTPVAASIRDRASKATDR